MSYKKASNILPTDLLEKIQEYIDGECIYIPRISNNKKEWGAMTSTREELAIRNNQIYNDYLKGINTNDLAQKYFLSLKSIQRVIGKQKKNYIE